MTAAQFVPRLLLWLLCVGAHRDSQGVLAPATSVSQIDQDVRIPDKARLVQLPAGILGISLDSGSGIFRGVQPNMPGEKAGLKRGDQIIEVDGQAYRAGVFWTKHGTNQPMTIMVREAPEMAKLLERIRCSLALPACALGCILILASPWCLYSRYDKGLAWQLDSARRSCSWPFVAAVLAFACARTFSAWQDIGHMDFLTSMLALSEVVRSLCLVTGTLSNMNNPSFSLQLLGTVSSAQQKMDLAAWTLFVTGALCSCIDAVIVIWKYLPRRPEAWGLGDFSDSVLILGRVPETFMLLALCSMASYTSAASRQRMLEVQERMPCQASDLAEEVHKPCGKVLRDAEVALSSLGWPLALLASTALPTAIQSYSKVRALYTNASLRLLPGNWVFIFYHAVLATASLLPAAFCLQHLSSAIHDFEGALNRERLRDPSLHGQLQAMETALDRLNRRQGWGIKLFPGLVLTQSLLQTVIVRIVLVSAAILAFLEKGVPAVTYDFQILPGAASREVPTGLELVRQRLLEKRLVNPNLAECKKRGIPHYSDKKFHNPAIGPTIHQVCAGLIRPVTEHKDPFHGISRLSYALNQNPLGLLCDLFISHAWAEGIFELTGTVLNSWPKECGGAYICALANPQNLLEFLSRLIANPFSSPFFRVLLCRPKKMLMVANANVPIHSRLWCVFEAHCARHLEVPTAVVGDPAHFATNAGASKSAARAIGRAVEARRREEAINDAAEDAAVDMDIIAASIYARRYEKWAKKAQRSTEKAMDRMKKALDVRLATCSSADDAAAIWLAIAGQTEEINEMICDLIIQDQLARAPKGHYKLTWYPGQDAIEGLCSMFS
ncbi:unnamed protein product [Symbiodinium natans]|uniref:PDZ domain-containing protein n=1 Tax=Symbiodinium natans TaxID=878477 RepID=A0A812R8X8_9DINO|nr:unnamed protein product [Symbiodinium natans]